MPGDSEVIDSGSSTTIDVNRYVEQLEKRIQDQEVLIDLFKEKVVGLEEKVASLEGCTIPRSVAGCSGAGDSTQRERSKVKDSVPSFVGSKKTHLASVSSAESARYCQIFASRLDPAISAADLAKDLLKDAPNLMYVKCSKMKTLHPSYSSFHVAVPEEQKQLVFVETAWPDGAFVKEFEGRLLQSHTLESYDSQTDETKTFSLSKSSKNTSRSAQSKSGSVQDKHAPPERKPTEKAKPSSRSVSSGKSNVSKSKPVDRVTDSTPGSHKSPTSSPKPPIQSVAVPSSTKRGGVDVPQISPKNLRPHRAVKNT